MKPKTHNGKYVSYIRVSTDKQGKSGLGLEAQKQAIQTFLNGGKWEMVGEFQEVESGKNNRRPELAKALEVCRREKATLITAKLDRLARNAAFVLGLKESGVEFIACDFPEANRLMITILAALAEYEGGLISQRTRDALAAAKQRGQKLGNPNPAGALATANTVRLEAWSKWREQTLPVIQEIQAAGLTTLAEIANALNVRGIKTMRGKMWAPQQVKNMLAPQPKVVTQVAPAESGSAQVIAV